MYNKYRTQFAVIHDLEKEIGIPKPLIAQLKYDLRQRMALDDANSFKAGRMVKQYDDGTVIVLVPILEAYFNLTAEDVARIFGKDMNCGHLTAMAAPVSPSPVGISWSSGRDSGTHITASVATAKQEKETCGLGKSLVQILPSPH